MRKEKMCCWSLPKMQEVDTPAAGTTGTVIPVGRRVATGTGITVGRRAATVAVDITQRQFYASFDEWGDQLRAGDVVTFRVDTSRVAGRHVVGKCAYDRHYCLPIDDSLPTTDPAT